MGREIKWNVENIRILIHETKERAAHQRRKQQKLEQMKRTGTLVIADPIQHISVPIDEMIDSARSDAELSEKNADCLQEALGRIIGTN